MTLKDEIDQLIDQERPVQKMLYHVAVKCGIYCGSFEEWLEDYTYEH